MLEVAVEGYNIRKIYEKVGFFKRERFEALKRVNILVKRGESYGIVGESGSGKSTLCRIICGLDRDFLGSLKVMGLDVKKAGKNLRKKVQMVFQNPYSSLNPLMTVKETLFEGIKIHKIKDGEERIYKLLERVGFKEDVLSKYPHQLSGGERQRIAIVRALSLMPDILIADEPLSALDLSIQAEILSLILSLKEELSLTLIFVSHDLRVVREVTERLTVLYDGYVVEEGDTEEIFSNPLHPYTAYLLDSVPVDHPGRRKAFKKNLEVTDSVKGACPFFSRCERRKDICFFEKPEEKRHNGRVVFCHNPIL